MGSRIPLILNTFDTWVPKKWKFTTEPRFLGNTQDVLMMVMMYQSDVPLGDGIREES